MRAVERPGAVLLSSSASRKSLIHVTRDGISPSLIRHAFWLYESSAGSRCDSLHKVNPSDEPQCKISLLGALSRQEKQRQRRLDTNHAFDIDQPNGKGL